MKTSSTISKIVMVIVGIVAIFLVSRYVFTSKAVPSLDQFFASSTETTDNDSAVSTTTDNLTLPTSPLSDDTYSTTDVSTPNGKLHVLISDTPEKMELGLSFRDSLPDSTGMLFKFAKPGNYEFWMKDMKFPLDIVWLNENKQVISISQKLSPDSFPNTYSAGLPILYALEINAGSALRLGIATGTILKF